MTDPADETPKVRAWLDDCEQVINDTFGYADLRHRIAVARNAGDALTLFGMAVVLDPSLPRDVIQLKVLKP